MKLGLLADTHGWFDPRLPEIFAGVEHILHAGDIGPPEIILQLGQIAPVTAVLGNNDSDPQWRETELVTLAGRRFLVHHIVVPGAWHENLRRRIEQARPDALVFGHTHKPFAQTRDGLLQVNPGYAGRARFDLPRSVAVLEVGAGELRPEFVPL